MLGVKGTTPLTWESIVWHVRVSGQYFVGQYIVKQFQQFIVKLKSFVTASALASVRNTLARREFSRHPTGSWLHCRRHLMGLSLIFSPPICPDVLKNIPRNVSVYALCKYLAIPCLPPIATQSVSCSLFSTSRLPFQTARFRLFPGADRQKSQHVRRAGAVHRPRRLQRFVQVRRLSGAERRCRRRQRPAGAAAKPGHL